jgi:hypothetical protein
MNEAARRVLDQFDQMGSETLDLHTLLEAGGNDSEARESVIETLSELVGEGYLEDRGSDFYALTLKGQQSLIEELEADRERTA